MLCFSGLVKETVPVNAILTSFKNDMSENVLGIGMAVLPHKRDLHLVLMLERISHDCAPIRALQSRFSDITTEICFHFDCPFKAKPLNFGLSLSSIVACCC